MLDSRDASVRQLEQVVLDFGPALWLDANVAEGILRDFLPGLPRERRALCLGVVVGFPVDSLNAKNPTEQLFIEIRAKKRMSDDHLMSEADAKWVVDSWNKALQGQRESHPTQLTPPHVPGRVAPEAETRGSDPPVPGHVFPPPPHTFPRRAAPLRLIALVGAAIVFFSLLAIRHFVIGG